MSRKTSVSDKNERKAVKISHRAYNPHHKANTFGLYSINTVIKLVIKLAELRLDTIIQSQWENQASR